MQTLEELVANREEVLRVAAKHGAGNVAVFGSVARGEASAASDIDLLVDIVGETSPRDISKVTPKIAFSTR
jgi:predicted nucleotidyltransferase